MGDYIGSGSMTDCLLDRFLILKDILNSAELHYGKNQSKSNPAYFLVWTYNDFPRKFSASSWIFYMERHLKSCKLKFEGSFQVKFHHRTALSLVHNWWSLEFCYVLSSVTKFMKKQNDLKLQFFSAEYVFRKIMFFCFFFIFNLHGNIFGNLFYSFVFK